MKTLWISYLTGPCLVEVGPDAPVPAAEGVRDGGAEHRVDVGSSQHGNRVQEGEVVDHPHAETGSKCDIHATSGI